MICESYPWKQDLRRRKNLIFKYNKPECFEKNEDNTFIIIEKTIFYSAFIIRKLIDCGGKLSDEADNYSLTIFSIAPLKPVDRMHRYPEDDSHDWDNEEKVIISGKFLCNSLIHSFLFFFGFHETNTIDSFFVSSDYDKNKILYRVPLNEWIKYIDFIISDEIVRMDSHYSSNHSDYIYTRKERGKR